MSVFLGLRKHSNPIQAPENRMSKLSVKKISRKSNERVVSADFFQSLDVRGLVNLSDFWSVSPWRRVYFWILSISGVSLYYDITDILTVLHNISILYYNAFFSLQLDACLGHWITGDVWVRLGSMWSFGMIHARQISTRTAWGLPGAMPAMPGQARQKKAAIYVVECTNECTMTNTTLTWCVA